MNKKNLRTLRLHFLVLVVCSLVACRQQKEPPPEDFELVASWADLATYITKNTPANSPTFASRCFGYIGLTMYESVVHGFPDYQSVAPQLNGLGTLPPPEEGKPYTWQLALNAGQAEILRNIYVQTSDENKAKIDSLETSFRQLYTTAATNDSVVARSEAYGRMIADHIFEWSKTDGGHRAYLHNFDKAIVYQKKPGSWEPPLYAQSFSHFPLHPHWGTNRTFLVVDSQVTAPPYMAYDTTPGSEYYKEFMAVYEKERTLTTKEKQTAIWWGDDPDETFTPPGHSFYIATIATRKAKPDLITAAKTYACVGMAVADAFRDCWKWKFHYFTERPNTFIPQHIDRNWHSFWPDPPFPAFPSGHAIQAAAAATVLSHMFGAPFAFTDSAHAFRPRDEIRKTDFVVRGFNNFWDVAVETANSRFYGGIHTHKDNDAGLTKGKEIAENVINLKWKKSAP